MKRIHYADGYVITGDALAAAVVEYARTLADRGQSGTVDLPGIDDSGLAQRFQLLLGPASQMLVSVHQTDAPEIEDPAVVSDVERRTARLRGSEPEAVRGDDHQVPLDADEF